MPSCNPREERKVLYATYWLLPVMPSRVSISSALAQDLPDQGNSDGKHLSLSAGYERQTCCPDEKGISHGKVNRGKLDCWTARLAA